MHSSARSDRGSWLFATAIGPCRISWSGRGITEVTLLKESPAHDPGSSEPLPAYVADAAERIARHLAGAPQDLTDIPLDMAGLPSFHRHVYEAARAIPPGRTASYGEIAARLGAPGAARAVGQALGKNPFLLVIPCHRVLASGGAPGGFSAPGGVDTKARMLAIEGVTAGKRARGTSRQLSLLK